MGDNLSYIQPTHSLNEGRNIINTNFALLKNSFAGTTAPTDPVEGQLWYNYNTKELYIYRNSQWEIVNNAPYLTNVNILKYSPKVVNSGASLTIDPSIASYWDITVNANTTLTFVDGTLGDILYVNIKQDDIGNRNINYLGNIRFKSLPQVPGSFALYKLQWYIDRWVVTMIYALNIINTNMLTKHWKQNPFKDGIVDDITGWTTGPSLPGGLSASQAIATKNRVYLLGGYGGSNIVSTVYIAPINPDGTLGAWTTGPSLPVALVDSQAIITKNRIYLLGGYVSGIGAVSTTYTAPINSDGTLGAWTTGSNLPINISKAQAILTKNRVYLITPVNTYTASINFDGTLGAWTTGPSLPSYLLDTQAIVTNSRVYLLGGINGNVDPTSIVYTAPINLDGTLGSWVPGPSLPGPLFASEAVVTKNRVFLLGGATNISQINSVSTVYTAPINEDGTLGTWTTGTNLLSALRGLRAIITKSRIYTLGGINSNSTVVSTVYTAPFTDGWKWPDPHSAYYEDNGII